MDARTFSVAEVTEAIRMALEATFPGELWVQGEIQSLTRSRTGHVYFDLVDAGELGRSMQARLPVALFMNHKQQVNAILRRSGGVRMTDGIEIRIRGAVDFYPPQGRLQLRMSSIDPAYTLGRLAADRQRLLAALSAEGLLDRQKALPAPPAPLRVALVTSFGSAAYNDFVHELAASGFGFTVIAVDARVQGDLAQRSVTAALSRAAQLEVDVVALVRGGGSRTDLAVFDGEAIARAVASLAAPVWTGIGHEIDTAIADVVAHRSFKTPTACAAALVDEVSRYVAHVEERWGAIGEAARLVLAQRERALAASAARAARETHAGLRLAEARLSTASARLVREAELVLRRAELNLRAGEARVRALDPARSLARGWSITRDGEGALLRSAAQAPLGSTIVTEAAFGVLTSTVADPAGASPRERR
ncbi:MAG: exodeoxyribonuclease VII large subunit [Acidimicrobiales bacterium]